MRSGILGGTFDPPHCGHLRLAESALATREIDRVLLIPSRQPPHKDRPDISPAHVRLEMVQAIARPDNRLEVEELELSRQGPSYTVETVRALQEKYPADSFRLIIGADLVEEFHLWREAEALLRLAPPLLAVRPGSPLSDDLVTHGPAELNQESRALLQAGRFPMPPTDISSTDIRTRIASGKPVDAETLPPAVLEIIRKHQLYRK